jgi:hypothetical protein
MRSFLNPSATTSSIAANRVGLNPHSSGSQRLRPGGAASTRTTKIVIASKQHVARSPVHSFRRFAKA